MKTCSLEQADKHEFAVHQVIYSNADIEMWYDWHTRLNDTKFTDQCYWVQCGEDRIGGVIKLDDTIMHLFVIPPFTDRQQLWEMLLACCQDIRYMNGVLQEDVPILLALGFEVVVTRQVMCCPASNSRKLELPPGFSLHPIDDSIQLSAFIQPMRDGYQGGVDQKAFGARHDGKIMEDLAYLMKVYQHRNLSIYMMNEQNREIVGLCLAGIYENMPLGFAEIAEICVVPSYRSKGLAAFMLHHVKQSASADTDVVKLCVTMGNDAERLYKKAGFQAGPPFARMKKSSNHIG
ncbi:GNAT family N-acetyltransferase [Paenibacillus aquistagni]|uniref:Acetyltransferase (GNAT) domain-containing protein n=1 Tax=Paenibacillus aquistagni TaxID=1852522 RepID=A0A1X7K1W8_9BACL|nr:GNAT family N-acetyltransferase [Paenibacillus aquistagni]SMG34875.1 Acetyltransferase (GNAT) domain-containing protein [Paenibacillus aquistagni]